MSEIKFKVNGFHCDSCVRLATMKIKKIAGVESVDIKEDGESVVRADREIGLDELSQAVASSGHTIEKI